MASDNLAPLLRLYPVGALQLEDGALAWDDLDVLGQALDVAERQATLLLAEVLPNTAGALLTSWERVYDVHRIAPSVVRRRGVLVAQRRLLPDFRPATLEAIFEQASGLALDLYEPFAFRCDDPDSLCDDADDLLDGAFVFVLDGSAVEARAESPDIDLIDEVIDRVKPSHTIGFLRWDNFACDDPYSRCDRDLLGV